MRILSVTTGRSDVGLLEPVWREIRKREGWELVIVNLGRHRLSSEWTSALCKFHPRHEGDASPGGITLNMHLAFEVSRIAYLDLVPDLILVVGDRYEALAAVAAAVPFGIPVAHIGGGDETTGSYDNQFRHAITKMAHLHFVAHEKAQERVLAMGEEQWRVHLTGLPSIDGVREWLENNPRQGPGQELVVIFHPPTLELDSAEEQAREVGKALARVGRAIKAFVPGRDVLYEKVRLAMVEGMGAVAGQVLEWADQEPPSEFYRTLSRAACLVGNSSAGIVEACSFGLPVINIGSRQSGRVKPINVWDLPSECGAIVAAVVRVLSPEVQSACQGLENPYGDGHAAERIVEVLAVLPRSVWGPEGTSKRVLLKKRWPEWRKGLS